MKTEVRNEFILEAHKSACSEWKLKIEKECPELFKTKLEVGKWYKNSDTGYEKHISFCEKVDDSSPYLIDGVFFGYGFNRDGNWYKSMVYNASNLWTPATEEEVKEALIKEAKKRGFKNGIKFYSALYPVSDKIIGESDDIIDWKFRHNVLYMCGYNGAVFNNGQWATIISNPIEDKIKELQKQLDELKKQL